MRINKQLNLIIPVDYEDDGQLYIHSTPISREVFEQHFLVISKTFAAIFAQGLGAVAGPRIAYLMLKQTAETLGIWESTKNGLINEIIRLSNVFMPTKEGWRTLPLQAVINKEMLNPEIIAEIEGELAFFICVSMMNKKNQIAVIMEAANGLWGSETTYLASTEYLASLTTSTETENSGAMETTSSVPS